jgi:repressor of nif and glnA expression
MDKKKKKQLSILGILKLSRGPLTSTRIASELAMLGQDASGRTVRLYLKEMDAEGLTVNEGKRGRRITERGLSELDSSQITERVGFLSAKIDRMTYVMDFDLAKRSGTVVVNITLVPARELAPRLDMICKVYEQGYAMGRLVTLFEPGERVGRTSVPEGMVGIGTVCSITLNGVLLKYGVPTKSRFGGLLEIEDSKPTRFLELISYDGSSIDPLEVFIRSGMTDHVGVVTTGNGRIGAGFRELPDGSRALIEDLADKLSQVGLGGFMTIGRNGQPVVEIPVSEGSVGAIVVGGLNPVSVLEETELRVYSRAMAGLVDYSKLFRYEDLPRRVGALGL